MLITKGIDMLLCATYKCELMSPAFTIYNVEIHFRDSQKHLYILTKHVECFISNLLKNKNSFI